MRWTHIIARVEWSDGFVRENGLPKSCVDVVVKIDEPAAEAVSARQVRRRGVNYAIRPSHVRLIVLATHHAGDEMAERHQKMVCSFAFRLLWLCGVGKPDGVQKPPAFRPPYLCADTRELLL